MIKILGCSGYGLVGRRFLGTGGCLVVLDIMLVFGIFQHVDVSLRGSVEVGNFNIHIRDIVLGICVG